MAGRFSKAMAACAGVAVASVSCGDSEPAPPGDADSFVATDGVLKDAMGREVILRGINARVRGIFDVDFDDGRTSLETIPPFVEDDCRFIAEELGMNHLRLPVNWSALEPVKGQYDEAQLDEIVSLAEACDRHGVQTLVDLHQDAYSKEIGEDGAPLWAIVPPPTELLEGPLDDLSARRTSAQVLDAFDHFFNDAEGVETAYAKMAAWLAAGVSGKPGIIGLELMNEPVLIVFEGRLDDFHDRVAAEVRKAAPSLTVFFEPNSTRNLTDRADVRRRIAFDDAVYAPHLYVDVFEDGWASMDVGAILTSATGMTDEAAQLGATPYVGEMGSSPDDAGLAYDRAAYDVLDQLRMSAAFWVYEEWSQGGWGLYDVEGGGRGALREPIADVLARPFPMAIGGHLESFAFDASTRALTVRLSHATSKPHVIGAPRRTYPNGVSVRCDGEAVDATPSGGRVEVTCNGSEIVVTPAP